ncbi:MAG TPA: type VI secretion system baseplate subunit TssE [Bryobacteraceae bacterium]|nr:type VI secretion system baseplate subunit TssE [Bryobacteraceae bacterium]
MESRDKLSYVKAGGREPRPSRRAPVPLFDRLTASSDPSREAVEPLRSLTPHLAFESVRAELQRLLNTRTRPGWSPAPGQVLTATEYGMPDFAHLSAADVVERDSFAGLIGRIIEAFEPRLKQVRVILVADPANQRALLGAIQGRIRIGIIDQPVSFPLELHTRSGDATVEAPRTKA